jgi:DNA-binding Xre family transcriptional regulator
MKVTIDLERLLKQKQWRLSDLEKKTGMSYQQLWNIKTGRTSKINFETIGLFLEAFECEPNELFTITKS